jgi:WW domain-containing oxidoreductase
VQEPSKQAKDEKLSENLWRLTKEVLESKIGELPYEMKTETVSAA